MGLYFLQNNSTTDSSSESASNNANVIVKHDVYSRDKHTVSRNDISSNAIKVLYRLHNAGYRACLVGGGVRDILLGFHPKDFDVATDASPEQVRDLFRNCRLIGRRFRLAHILFGREIIEVATFRGHHSDIKSEPDEVSSNKSAAHSTSDGRILRDNVFGSIEEDAIRRDFTVNALYYDIADFSVLDFCDGMEDLKNKLFRMIGDPETRYREDPVRMLRAVRLSIKLGLTIEEKTAEPIARLAPLLLDIPSARLWEESHKLLLSGHSANTFLGLEQHNLLQPLLPQMCEAIERNNNPNFRAFIQSALANTDARINNNKSLNPAFLYACFLWQSVQDCATENRDNGYSPAEAMQNAQAMVISKQVQSIAIPRRFTQVIREIWLMQYRLVSRRGKKLLSILDHPRFRAAYDFMLLRATIGEVQQDVADWWTDIQKLNSEQQKKMFRELHSQAPGRKKKKRRPKKNNPTTDANSDVEGNQ